MPNLLIKDDAEFNRLQFFSSSRRELWIANLTTNYHAGRIQTISYREGQIA